MTDFWKSDTYLIVKAMKATGNQTGIIQEWRNAVEAWAAQSNSPDAEAVRAWLPLWRPRPFYTAAELAPIFPALSVALKLSPVMGRIPPQKSPNRLANELIFAGLPYREVEGKKYFIVEQIHVWRDAPDAAIREIIDAQR